MRSASVLIVEEGGRGGVARYTAELAAALARRGWKVRLATARDHTLPAADGVRIHAVFPYVRDRTPAGRLLRRLGVSRPINGLTHVLVNLRVAVLARRCCVVHVQDGEWPPLGALQAVLLSATRRPVVHTSHNTFDRGARTYRRSHALVRRLAAALIVHSEFDRRALGPPYAGKTHVIPHGEYAPPAGAGDAIDPVEARRRLGLDESVVVALLFGQLRPDKGIRDLLLASRGVEGLVVVLAGEDLGGLADVDDLLGPAGRVIVRPGFVAPADADALLAASDVVALPYARASASGVLLLAYGLGRPVVAYPVGGLPEYVEDGVTGWITPRADPGALATTLRAIVAAGRDECRRRGAAAQARSGARFGWDAIAARTAAIYADLAAPVSR